MATNQINMNELLRDPYKAYGYWADKKYGDNTANLTDEQYDQLCEKWDDYQAKWDRWAQSEYSSDSNGWHIDPQEFDDFFNQGQDSIKNQEFQTDDGETQTYENTSQEKAERIGTNIVLDTTSGANAIMTLLTKLGGNTIFGIVSCITAAVTGLMTFINKPNKEETTALEAYGKTLTNTKNNLELQQSNMTNAGAEVDATREEADNVNQSYQDEIAEKTAELEMYKHAYEQIQAKIASGANLTDPEKAMYKSAVKNMNLLAPEIEALEKDSQKELFEIQSDMTSKMEVFDAAQEKIAYASGQAKTVADFDEATKNSINATRVGDALNVAAGATSGAKALAKGAAKIALQQYVTGALYLLAGAAGMAGAAASTADLTAQNGYMPKVASTIDTRKLVETTTVTTNDALETGVSALINQVQSVDEIEVILPDLENLPTSDNIPNQSGDNGNPRQNPFLT